MSHVHDVKRAFIFCSDPSVKLWRNVKQKLVLPEERVVALSWFGGPIALANREVLPSDFAFILNQISFLRMNLPAVTEINPIGHKCRYYGNVSSESVDIERMEEDLVQAAFMIMATFDGVSSAPYYAHDINGSGQDFTFKELTSAEV